MRAVYSGGTPPRTPRHAVFRYYHPLDECRNGGMHWEVVFDEVAPGLFDIRHPKCSICMAEPQIESFEFLDGEVSDFRQAMVVSADGQSVTEERVPLTPVEKAFKPS